MAECRIKNGLLTTGDYDGEKYPIPPLPIVPSKSECRHTPIPEVYHSWYEWCERASKTHAQVRCPRCSRWAIWLPKAVAKEINKRAAAEEREVAKLVKRQLAAEYRAKARKLERQGK